MQLIEHYEVPSGGAASITFSAIPDTFTDLVIVLSSRNSNAAVFGEVGLQFNGATSGYSFRALQGTGSSTVSFSSDGTSTSVRAGLQAAGNATANTFGSFTIYIPNYRSSVSKSFSSDAVSENNGTTAYQEIIAGLSSVTSAITSISIVSRSTNFVQYSSASLFGVLAGSDGIVAVS